MTRLQFFLQAGGYDDTLQGKHTHLISLRPAWSLLAGMQASNDLSQPFAIDVFFQNCQGLYPNAPLL